MATLKVRSKTSSTITVYITGLDASYSNKERNVYWSCVDSTVYVYPAKSTIDNGISQTDDIELSGFSASTTYTITARITYYDANGTTHTVDLTAKATTQAEAPTITRPAKFSWVKSIVAKGKDAIIYASDWNALTANINDVRAYRKEKGYTVSSPTKFSFTTALRGHDLTADMFNEVLEAIKGISGYGTWFREFSKGEDCTAELLNSVVAELNTIP